MPEPGTGMKEVLAIERVRSSICVVCRRRVATGSTCHRVKSTLTRSGRAKIKSALRLAPLEQTQLEHGVRWGARIAAKLTLYGVTPALGYALALVKGVDPFSAIAAVTFGLLPIVALAQNVAEEEGSGPRLVSSLVNRLTGARPNRHALPAVGVTGIAEGGIEQESPAGGIICLAYHLEFHHKSAEPTTLMLLDGYTSGFQVMSAEGPIEILAGPIALVPAPAEVKAFDRAGVTERLLPLDLSLVHFDEVRERTLSTGTRVRLRNSMETRFVKARLGSYRDAATQIRVPVGTPIIEILGGPQEA